MNTIILSVTYSSIHYVVVSVACICYSYSRSVKLRVFKFVENDYLHGDVTPQFFFIFRIKMRSQPSTFSLRIFLNILMNMEHKRKMYPLTLIYSKGCKCKWGQMSMGMWVIERTLLMTYIVASAYIVVVDNSCRYLRNILSP